MTCLWTHMSLLLLDIDECQNGPVCQQNAACLNMPGSYRCECKAGYRFTPTGQCLGKAAVVISYGLQRDKKVSAALRLYSTLLVWSMFVTVHSANRGLVSSYWPQGDYTQLVETLSSIREKIREASWKNCCLPCGWSWLFWLFFWPDAVLTPQALASNSVLWICLNLQLDANYKTPDTAQMTVTLKRNSLWWACY